MKFQKDNDLDLYAYITCKKQSLYDTIIFIYINAEWMRRKSIENLYLYNFHITCLGQVFFFFGRKSRSGFDQRGTPYFHETYSYVCVQYYNSCHMELTERIYLGSGQMGLQVQTQERMNEM